MKARISRQDDQTPHPKPLAISLPEIALISGYFLAVWLIPASWLDTAIGAMAFAIASAVNPYLSEYSIAFSADPRYFIHCHVLATLLFPTLLPYLIIKRNGGRIAFSLGYRRKIDQFGGWLAYLTLSVLLFGLLYFSMVWLVDHPLTGGERAIWISAIAPSALMMSVVFGLGVMQIYMIIFSAFSNKEMQL
jgi:hypothetical protein